MSTPVQLSLKAKKIFAQVLARLDSEGCAKIGGNDNGGIMPLTVECIDPAVDGKLNQQIYSFCHYYKQNGDMMQDPEVTFLVVDERPEGEPENFIFFHVFAMTFQQANLSIYQEAMTIDEGKIRFAAAQQKDITVFCNQWMQNILHQNLKVCGGIVN